MTSKVGIFRSENVENGSCRYFNHTEIVMMTKLIHMAWSKSISERTGNDLEMKIREDFWWFSVNANLSFETPYSHLKPVQQYLQQGFIGSIARIGRGAIPIVTDICGVSFRWSHNPIFTIFYSTLLLHPHLLGNKSTMIWQRTYEE